MHGEVTLKYVHQDYGVVKVNSVDGNSVDAQNICLAACLKHGGATGCEIIWDQSNRGCYIHTSRAIDHGNGDGYHKFVMIVFI